MSAVWQRELPAEGWWLMREVGDEHACSMLFIGDGRATAIGLWDGLPHRGESVSHVESMLLERFGGVIRPDVEFCRVANPAAPGGE